MGVPFLPLGAPRRTGFMYRRTSWVWVGEDGQMTGALGSWLRTSWGKDGRGALPMHPGKFPA